MNENDEGFTHPKPHTDRRASANIEGKWYYPEEMEQVERQNAARRAEAAKKRGRCGSHPGRPVMYGVVRGLSGVPDVSGAEPSCGTDAMGSKVEYDEHKLFEHGLCVVEDHRHEREESCARPGKGAGSSPVEHEHLNGRRCKAPRLKRKLCRMHERLEEARTVNRDLGPMEDADSIQVGIKKLQGAIIEGTLEPRQVGQLAYTIQLAAWNVTRTTMNRSGKPNESQAAELSSRQKRWKTLPGVGGLLLVLSR